MIKRVFLFLLTNLLVLLSVSVVLKVLGLEPLLNSYNINYQSLMIFCLVYGMVGSFISLQLSIFMAKKMMGVEVVDNTKAREQWQIDLVAMVYTCAKKAGLKKMPEVGVFYSDEMNAFATGPSKNKSLVAVSSGLLNNMNRDEIEAVIGHEVAHIANGDMVTMTLLQGIVNAFVMFFARILAQVVSTALRSNSESRVGGGFIYFGLVIAFEIVLMILGSLVVNWFSRYREYRADAGGAAVTSRDQMIAALRKLGMQGHKTEAPDGLAALQMYNKKSFMELFSTHPSLDKRIKKLQKRSY